MEAFTGTKPVAASHAFDEAALGKALDVVFRGISRT